MSDIYHSFTIQLKNVLLIDCIYSLLIFRLRLAFDLATRFLRIDALLDPEDVHTNKPDKKSILMYIMCLYQAIESIRSTQLTSAGSVQMLDQHFETGSCEEIHSPSSETTTIASSLQTIQPSTSSASVQRQMHDSASDGQTEPSASNTISLTDLDEVSLAKSIEDLDKIFPVQRSSTFTITKNESINLTGADAAGATAGCVETIDLDDDGTRSANFQQFIESRSRPVSTATNLSVEIGSYQNAIEIVLSLLLEAEERLSKPMPDIHDLSDAKAHFQSHEEFMIKLSEYQEYVGGALEEGARLLSEPIANCLTADDQSEIKQQMLLLNERWELLRLSALEVQSRVHAKLATVQMQKIEQLRLLLTNTEDGISRMPDIDPNPAAFETQFRAHKELEATLNEQKRLVDDLSNLVVIVNDDLFNELEDKLTALGERWTHVVKWTKNRFEKLQAAHFNWRCLKRQFAIVADWINVREMDLKQMESQDVSAIGSVMARMQHLRFCALDLTALADNIVRLEEIAQHLKPAANELLDRLETVQDRCDALKEIVDVQQQRIERMGFDFNIDIFDNIKLPAGWTDFQTQFRNVDRQSSLMDDSRDSDASDNDEDADANAGSANKKRKLQKSEKYQQLRLCIQDMTRFVVAGENLLATLNSLTTLKDQANALQQLQTDLKQKIDEYPNVKALLQECIESDGTDLPTEANEISDVGTKLDELNFRAEHLMELNQKALHKQKYQRNLTGLKLVLADCQDWFKQYANLNASTRDELENRLAYMESLRGEISEAQEFYRNADDKHELHEWKADFDQFHQSWMDIESAIKRLVTDNFNVDDDEDDDERMPTSDDEIIDDDDDAGDELIEQKSSPELEKFEATYSDAAETDIVVSNLENMQTNLNRLNELRPIVAEACASNEIKNRTIESEKWQQLDATIADRITKQETAIQNFQLFSTEFNQVADTLNRLSQSLADDDAIVPGEVDELCAHEKQYEATGMEIKKIEIDIISVKNFSEVIIRTATDATHKAQLLEQIQSLNDHYTRVKKQFQTNCKALKAAVEQTKDVLQRIDGCEKWLNELETSTPTVTNQEITNSNQLFQIRNKFQALKETCEQKTIEFRELNDVGSEMLLRIDEQLTRPKCTRKYSTLAKQFTKLNAKWNEVTTLVYNRTALLEHISSQLGELKTLIVSETGYLDKLEKCLRKSPENAADAEEIYEELDVRPL